jgi:hypothetical protein
MPTLLSHPTASYQSDASHHTPRISFTPTLPTHLPFTYIFGGDDPVSRVVMENPGWDSFPTSPLLFPPYRNPYSVSGITVAYLYPPKLSVTAFIKKNPPAKPA